MGFTEGLSLMVAHVCLESSTHLYCECQIEMHRCVHIFSHTLFSLRLFERVAVWFVWMEDAQCSQVTLFVYNNADGVFI